MDAYIRNLHRDGVPLEIKEEEPVENKESEGKQIYFQSGLRFFAAKI